MPPPPFFLDFQAVQECSIANFRTTLGAYPKRRIAEVTILDLCSMPEYPNGLYFFFNQDERPLQYVGKCTSRSFVERIPAHFDQREDAWFNTVPRKLVEQRQMTYQRALEEALTFEVVLLGINEADLAADLERIFRHTYQPALNTPKRPHPFKVQLPLAQAHEAYQAGPPRQAL